MYTIQDMAKYYLRLFWISLSPFHAAFALCGSLASLLGLYFLACPPNVEGRMVAFIVFLVSATLIVAAWIMGMLIAPYRLSVEESEKATMKASIEKQKSDILRMRDAIEQSKSALIDICDSITRGKGERGDPPDSRFILLENVHDSIYKTIVGKTLKSITPFEDKDV